MPTRSRLNLGAFAATVGLATLVGWWIGGDKAPILAPKSAPRAATPNRVADEPEREPLTTREIRQALADQKLAAKLRAALARSDARKNELILKFKDDEAYQRFLNRTGSAGLKVLSRLDRLQSVRVLLDDFTAFEADLNNHPDDYADLDANLLVYPPQAPAPEERTASKQVPVGSDLLEFLGVSGDLSDWGRGVTIAVLDSGVAADATFGEGRLRFLDVGMGLVPLGDDGHGTAVAALAAGFAPDAQGVAPGANVLSIRVTDTDGLGDSFTLSQAIMAAADNGARIINISMGAYGTTPTMLAAIDHALSLGAMIVASAGNDQTNQLTWPAAHPSVVSVGAVDGAGQQVIFSNSGEGLKITAPGFGVPTAWTTNQRVYMDGTSASAPIVAGGLAALMSNAPGLTAAQAWGILQRTTSDGGPAGADVNYGAGIINLGWALDWKNPSRIDTAISSHYLNPDTGDLEVVVQNRSGTAVTGLELTVSPGNGSKEFTIPWLPAGGEYVAKLPIDLQKLQEAGRIEFQSVLKNASGINDAVPKNNQKGTSLSVSAAK